MRLTSENSWWNEGGLWQDPDLARVKNSRLNYRPKPFQPKDCKQSAMMTLRGPRRAGKTVSLKLLVAELVEDHGWAPRDITWTSFDTFRTLAQIEDHLTEVAKRYRPRLLLVDEVTSVIGWQRVLKKLRDNGTLTDACVLLTGSSAYDLKAGAERMAGRRGNVHAPDRVLLPMSFVNFREQVGKERGTSGNYLRVGGFPFRVEDFLRAKQEDWSESVGLQILDDVLFYEIGRRRLDRSIAMEIVGRLAAVKCSASSYEGFVKPLSMAKDTARKYLDAFGDAFLLATLSTFDTARNRVAPKKDRKFVWIDSSLGYLASWLRTGPEPDEATLAEWAVGSALLRESEVRLWEGLSAPRNVFTWKSSSGNEIDFLIVDRSKGVRFPVEVKYQQTVSDWDFQVLERAFGKGCLVTREESRSRPKARAVMLDEFLQKGSC